MSYDLPQVVTMDVCTLIPYKPLLWRRVTRIKWEATDNKTKCEIRRKFGMYAFFVNGRYTSFGHCSMSQLVDIIERARLDVYAKVAHNGNA
jgi:hypothetical protein